MKDVNGAWQCPNLMEKSHGDASGSSSPVPLNYGQKCLHGIFKQRKRDALPSRGSATDRCPYAGFRAQEAVTGSSGGKSGCGAWSLLTPTPVMVHTPGCSSGWFFHALSSSFLWILPERGPACRDSRELEESMSQP